MTFSPLLDSDNRLPVYPAVVQNVLHGRKIWKLSRLNVCASIMRRTTAPLSILLRQSIHNRAAYLEFYREASSRNHREKIMKRSRSINVACIFTVKFSYVTRSTNIPAAKLLATQLPREQLSASLCIFGSYRKLWFLFCYEINEYNNFHSRQAKLINIPRLL